MEKKKRSAKLLIIGAGPAGYTAAIYAARAGLSPLLVQGVQPGGQLTVTTDVENYPGFSKPVQGPWLMEEMRAQAVAVGAEICEDVITGVDFSSSPFQCTGEKFAYSADAVVIATGASAKWLGLDSELYFRGHGVSACATCDGFFFKRKKVAVIGGGNTAVEEALFLTHHAEEVFLIHRKENLRAEKILQTRLFSHPKIHVVWNSVVKQVLGTDAPRCVTGLRLQNLLTNAEEILPIDGVFIAIGHQPNTDFLKNALKLDASGYIVREGLGTQTGIPGVFSAGDVSDKIYRQAVTAAAEGCMAAIDAEKFLSLTGKI